MLKINPYNFDPLADKAPNRTKWQEVPKHHRLSADTYSGHLDLKFYTITPVFIPSMRTSDVDQKKVPGRPDQHIRTFFRFHHNGEKPTIPGTSIKGMVRSVFEALTNSCMALYAGNYGRKNYGAATYKREECNKEQGLCLACSVFGTTVEDKLHMQGKILFSDAVGEARFLETGGWILKELSAPKPERHLPFYALDGTAPSSGPRGRKFYYHHNPEDVSSTPEHITKKVHNQRNVKILERLKAGATLTAKMNFHGLTKEELAALLYTLELEYRIEEVDNKKRIILTLGHKIGMGKPLGLGSVGILIPGGTIQKGNERYRSFAPQSSTNLRAIINEFRKGAPRPSDHLRDLLSLNKYAQGVIEYPDKTKWFDKPENKTKRLGEWGEYEGEQDESSQKDSLESTKSYPLDYGIILNGRIVKLGSDFLIIEAEDGVRYQRKRSAVQGIKAKQLVNGLKVTLKGAAVHPHDLTSK